MARLATYFSRFDDSVFDWAFEGGIQARRRSFVFGYGHLAVFAALAAVGVGMRLIVEAALAGGPATHASAVLGGGLALAVIALSLVQRAMPARLAAPALVARSCVAAIAIALAFLGDDLSAPAVSAVLASVLAATLAFEALRFP